MSKRRVPRALREAVDNQKGTTERTGAWAAARGTHVPARKTRLVVDLVRGRKVREAEAILRNTPRAASPIVLGLLRSAVANAEHNFGLAPEDLYVRRIFVDEGSTMKRQLPRAKGGAGRIRKRSSHVTIFVGTRSQG